MHMLIEIFLNKNKFHKRKICSRIAFKLRKWGVVGLVFMLCFTLTASPVFASSTGDEHHKDTRDYCMIVHDVTVGLQELEGRNESEKTAIVESASEYNIHRWYIYPIILGQNVYDYVTDYSQVNWSQEGKYTVTVSLPRRTVSSSISYYLTIIDDIEPEDPSDPTDPVDPSDPTDPSGPVDPSDPTDPTKPVDPSDPTEDQAGGPFRSD